MLDLTRLLREREIALDARRVVGVRAGELADVTVERRREEHRLPVPGETANDPVDLGLEAHVEHPVGLVEYERADLREVDEPSLREILEPAGGCDEDVGLVRPLRLRAERDSAVGGGDREPLGLCERPELVCHLRGELARRHEHERRGTSSGGRRALDDRESEGERLARPGRRPDEDVHASEGVGQDELLDPEGLVDRASGERVGDGRRHAELAKRLL